MTSRRTCLQSLLGTVTSALIGPSRSSAFAAAVHSASGIETQPKRQAKAQIAITLDLEMSANFPRWQDTHWNYEKGNLDQATKDYAIEAARRVKAAGGHIHFFCVGQVLEQENIAWLQQLSQDGHPIGNHTYDHINILASTPEELQFRFRRAPWLLRGQSVSDAIRENIQLTTLALKQRAGITVNGFRTPGGFPRGLTDRPDLRQLLSELGFHWISSRYPPHATGDAMRKPDEEVLQDIVARQSLAQPCFYPDGLLEIPMSPISDIGAFRTGRWQLEWFLEAIERCADRAIAEFAVFDFLAHPSCLVISDPEFKSIDLLCRLVHDHAKSAQLATLDQIAEAYRQKAAEEASAMCAPAPSVQERG